MGLGQRFAAAGATVVVAAALAACAPAPGPGTAPTTTVAEPRPPIVASFATRGGVGRAPATVALAWSVSDPNGDFLNCELDLDGDGVVDESVSLCRTGVRTVSVPTAGSVTATLTVTDGTPGHAVVATHTFVIGPDPVEPYDLGLRGLAALDPDVAAAFTSAATRWESIIVRGTPDFTLPAMQDCLTDDGSVPATIDDVLIDIVVEPIDGPGGILGSAGPTCFSTLGELPVSGEMTFDSADVAELLDEDSFDDVVLHEMGHVLGFGTLWDTSGYGGSRKLTSGVGTSTTRFTGARALAEYSALGGTGDVPVEASGGPGTQDAHWRETVFDDELMTGWIDMGDLPVSRVTVASLADMGFQVDLSAADPFILPALRPALRSTAEPAADPQADLVVLRPPLRRI